MAYVRHDFRTTIFSANIVGAGTGAHIEDSLKGTNYEDLVSEVGASEVTHEISFRHAPHIDINGICVILHKAAYEIYGARTINAKGHIVATLNFLYAADRSARPRQRNWRNSFVSQVNGGPSPSHSRESSRSRSRSRSRTRVRRLTGSHDVPIPTFSPSYARFSANANDVAFYDKTNQRSYIRDENVPVIRPTTQRTYTQDSSYSQPSFEERDFAGQSFEDRDVEKGFDFDIKPLRTAKTHERPDPVLATTLSPRLIPRKPTAGTPIRSALKPAASINRTYDATLSVGGMTCAACTNAVKDGLSELDYVESVTVDLMTNSAQVRYHGTAADAMKLAEAVEDLGFEGSVIKTTPFGAAPIKKVAPKKATFAIAPQEYETTLSVGGMTCAACTNAVKDALVELDWVRSANVDLMTNSASVKYFGTAQDAKKLADAVEEVGFEGSVIKVTPCTSATKAAIAKSSEPATLIASLSVGGMTCAACTNAVKDALSDIDWVKSATVDLMTNSARVEYQGTRQDAQKLVDAVEEVGFEGSIMAVTATTLAVEDKPQTKMYRATLSVGGMTCAACSSSVTEGIESLDFVEDCNVSLMTNSASVLFEGKQNLDKLIERVEDLGFECALKECIPVKAADEEDDVSESGPRTIDLKIEGLNSETAINEILGSLDDYASWAVVQNPPTLKHPVISMEYEPVLPEQTSRSLAALISEIDSSFHVSFYHPPSIEECSKQMQQHEKNRILRRLALALIAAIPTFIIGIVFMDLLSDMNPIRVYFMAPMWTGQVTCADWALFFTATPVMFFSADLFHTRALKEIRAIWRPGSKVPFARRFYRFGSMTLLISAGTSVAYFSSLGILIVGAVSKQPGALNNTYFDSVVFLTFFILIGKFLEAYSKSKTGDAVSMLAKLRPEKATLIVERESITGKEVDFEKEKEKELMIDVKEKGASGTSIATIDADFLEIGDRVLVPHGSSPPADGVLVTTEAKFDESSLTGESRAVTKVTGDSVFIGTINLGDPATIEITKLGGSSMLDQIVAVVREGQTKRAPIERVADILTGYFVPVITALAILTFTIWLILGYSGALDKKYLNGQQGGWAFWSLEFAIAVFVVACPCGIGLAAPTALFVGGGLAAKHGILVRGGGESFQEAGDLDAIVFDKTGTLTEGGDLKVTDFSMLTTQNRAVHWAIIRCLEEQSTHPLAKAIYETAQTQPQDEVIVDNITEVAGYGLRGTFILPKTSSRPREIVLEAALGNERLMTTLEPSPPPRNHYAEQLLSTWKNQGKSIAVLSVREVNDSRSTQDEWAVTTILATADPIRPSAFPAVKALQARGLQVYMLSGDNPETARAVAAELNIPASNVFAGVLPAQKQEKILYLQSHAPLRQRTSLFHKVTSLFSRNKRTSHRAKIAFVGDGINDAPALLAADVSISPSTGSPIALTSSSFVLLSPSLMTIPRLLNLSTRIFTRIRLNFAWALCYNIMLVPVAAGVFFRTRPDGFQLGPIWAAAAMAMSSLSVVCSSLALRYEGGWRFWQKKNLEEL